jgi:hypothetical protein
VSNIRKITNELSHLDCRGIKQANSHARRVLGCPLNLLVTYHPYPGSIPAPEEQARDLNRLQTYLRNFAARRGFAWVGLWVWHSRPNGRSPHPHVFMQCTALGCSMMSYGNAFTPSTNKRELSTFGRAATFVSCTSLPAFMAAASTTSPASKPRRPIGAIARLLGQRSATRTVGTRA